MRNVAERAIAATSVLTRDQRPETREEAAVLTGTSAAAVGTLEYGTNISIANAAETRADMLDRQAEQQASLGLLNNKNLSTLRADHVRLAEKARPPGGLLKRVGSENLNRVLDTENYNERRRALAEELRYAQVPAHLETKHYNNELRRNFGRIRKRRDYADAIHDRNQREQEREREWNGMDAFSRGRVHVKRAFGSLTEAATHVNETIEEGGIQGTLYRHVIDRSERGGIQAIIGRAEI